MVDEIAVLGAHVVRPAGTTVSRTEAVAAMAGLAVTGAAVSDLTTVVSVGPGDRAAGDVRVAAGSASSVAPGLAFTADAGLPAAVNRPHCAMA